MAMGHIYMQKITKTVRFAQSLKPQIQEHKLFFYLELTCRSMYSEELECVKGKEKQRFSFPHQE